MTPGATAQTLIPYFPKSLAIGKTMPSIAPLVAPYPIYPLCPSVAAILDTKIITPSVVYLAIWIDTYLAT